MLDSSIFIHFLNRPSLLIHSRSYDRPSPSLYLYRFDAKAAQIEGVNWFLFALLKYLRL